MVHNIVHYGWFRPWSSERPERDVDTIEVGTEELEIGQTPELLKVLEKFLARREDKPKESTKNDQSKDSERGHSFLNLIGGPITDLNTRLNSVDGLTKMDLAELARFLFESQLKLCNSDNGRHPMSVRNIGTSSDFEVTGSCNGKSLKESMFNIGPLQLTIGDVPKIGKLLNQLEESYEQMWRKNTFYQGTVDVHSLS